MISVKIKYVLDKDMVFTDTKVLHDEYEVAAYIRGFISMLRGNLTYMEITVEKKENT